MVFLVVAQAAGVPVGGASALLLPIMMYDRDANLNVNRHGCAYYYYAHSTFGHGAST